MTFQTDRLLFPSFAPYGCLVRREGYPNGQVKPIKANPVGRSTGAAQVRGVVSRHGSQRAKDAASRPEKPEVQTLSSALFLLGAEKSSIQLTS